MRSILFVHTNFLRILSQAQHLLNNKQQGTAMHFMLKALRYGHTVWVITQKISASLLRCP